MRLRLRGQMWTDKPMRRNFEMSLIEGSAIALCIENKGLSSRTAAAQSRAPSQFA
ncbi:MAG: hypothetical protein ACJAVZ_001980 [Afipia broomeae]|jgi:hypothetical protein|tara:strand:+ start:10852 stop:11016 length:165 start_codon:yes stop_codon:yes gene_type:complete